MWGNRAKRFTGVLLAFALMVTGPVAAFAEDDADPSSEVIESGKANSGKGKPEKDETQAPGNGGGQGNGKTDVEEDLEEDGAELAANNSSNGNGNGNSNNNGNGNGNGNPANQENESASDNAAQKDPTINLGGCETVSFTVGNSLLDALTGCLDIETFGGRSLLRLTASDSNLLNPVATNPPELVGNRPASVWSEVNGTTNAFEVEGSAVNLERALGEVLLEAPSMMCANLTLSIFGLHHVDDPGAPIMTEADWASVRVCFADSEQDLASSLENNETMVPQRVDPNSTDELEEEAMVLDMTSLVIDLTGGSTQEHWDVFEEKFQMETPVTFKPVEKNNEDGEVITKARIIAHVNVWETSDENDDPALKKTFGGVQIDLELKDRPMQMVGSRIQFGLGRDFTLSPTDFMPGSKLTVAIYSQRTSVGFVAATDSGDLSLAQMDPGDHTLHILGMSKDGVLWSFLVPVNLQAAPAANNFTVIDPDPELDEAVSEDEKSATEEDTQVPNDAAEAGSAPVGQTVSGSSGTPVETFTTQVFGVPLNPMDFDESTAGLAVAACSEPEEVQRIARVVSGKLLDDGSESEVLVEQVARANSALAACQASLSFRSADNAASGDVSPIGPQLFFWLLLLLLIPVVRTAVKRVRA
jgi:hypothetical protein